jgi:hypothetical protein
MTSLKPAWLVVAGKIILQTSDFDTHFLRKLQIGGLRGLRLCP